MSTAIETPPDAGERLVARGPIRARIAAANRRHPLIMMVTRRLLAGAALLWIVSVLIFVGTEILPGNAAYAILGRNATPVALAALSKQLHLGTPVYERYWQWVTDISHGNLGTSLTANESVSALIGSRLGNTLILAAIAMAVMLLLSVTLGVLAGIKPGGKLDNLISQPSLAVIAFPDFVVGGLLAVSFGVALKVVPPVSLILPGTSPLSQPDLLVLPVATLVIVGFAYMVRMVRAGMSEVMRSEYIEMAALNGIPQHRIILVHALRNALAPTVQVTALTLQWLLGGVFIVETLFDYPGIGQGFVNAVQARDIPTVQSLGMIIAALFVLINIFADVIVVLLIPKQRTQV
jgi:peptide/nickel transport system permease protein